MNTNSALEHFGHYGPACVHPDIVAGRQLSEEVRVLRVRCTLLRRLRDARLAPAAVLAKMREIDGSEEPCYGDTQKWWELLEDWLRVQEAKL